jgi:hypothetical protein
MMPGTKAASLQASDSRFAVLQGSLIDHDQRVPVSGFVWEFSPDTARVARRTQGLEAKAQFVEPKQPKELTSPMPGRISLT